MYGAVAFKSIPSAGGAATAAALFLSERLSNEIVFADMGAYDTTPARESLEDRDGSTTGAVEAASSSIRCPLPFDRAAARGDDFDDAPSDWVAFRSIPSPMMTSSPSSLYFTVGIFSCLFKSAKTFSFFSTAAASPLDEIFKLLFSSEVRAVVLVDPIEEVGVEEEESLFNFNACNSMELFFC